MNKRHIAILGATGSIGTQALDVISRHTDMFEVELLTANNNAQLLIEQALRFRPNNVVICNKDLYDTVNDALAKEDIKVFAGMESVNALVQGSNVDIVLASMVGFSGLEPTINAIKAGKMIALANKETLVAAGSIVTRLAREYNSPIIPVDSEHSAIFCLINQCKKENISELIITASGGPFKNYSLKQLQNVTLEDTLKHPTWNMGQKITIDSATLANKGLEVIEATRLFKMPVEKIKVIVHPQSIVHSLVRTNDGMLYAQLSDPDMKHPIFQSLVYPENKANFMKPFDLFDKELTFFKPRYDDFPMLKYAYEVAQKNGGYTIAYNAANEVAVKNFIDKKIQFMDIPKITYAVLQNDFTYTPSSFDDIFKIDSLARKYAEGLI